MENVVNYTDFPHTHEPLEHRSWLHNLIEVLWETTSDTVRTKYLKGLSLFMGGIGPSIFDLPQEQQNLRLEDARLKWESIDRHGPLSGTTHPAQVEQAMRDIPFHLAASEVLEVFHDPLFRSFLNSHGEIQGIYLGPLARAIFMAVENSDNEDGLLHEYLWRLSMAQPVYLANLERSGILSTRPSAKAEPKPATTKLLTELLHKFRTSRRDTSFILNQFQKTVLYLCDMYRLFHNRLRPEVVLARLKSWQNEELYFEYQNPFSTIPLSVRKELALVDFGTVLQHLDDVAQAIVNSHPLSQLSWRLHQWLLQIVQENSTDAVERVISYTPYLSELTAPSAMANPVLNYRPLGFPPITVTYEGLLSPEDDTNIDFHDIHWEPAGNPLLVTQYAKFTTNTGAGSCLICLDDYEVSDADEKSPRRRVQPNMCDHVFHEDCLDQLINTVEEYSNKYPGCRTVICPPRDRQRAPDDI